MSTIIIEKTIPRKIWMYQLDFENFTESKYFIQKIDEELNKANANYKTNVKGKMTSNCFLQDFNLIHLINVFKNHITSLTDVFDSSFKIKDAFGIRNDFGDYTRKHRHGNADIAGILYLNDSSQKLYFPDLKLEVETKPGRMLLWESSLWHEAKPNRDQTPKYAVVFNIEYTGMEEYRS